MVFEWPSVIKKQGWCSGESARLSPMWPEFDFGPVHMWVEFVVGISPCPGVFTRSLSFLPPQKLKSPNYNFTKTEDPVSRLMWRPF